MPILPLWPFRRPSIRHRTFGVLRPIRNGRFWRARVPLHRLPIQTDAAHPRPAPPAGASHGRVVEVRIAGDAGPTAAQEKLYLRISAHYPKVMAVALKAVHGEYNRVASAQPQLKWPAAPVPIDLLRLAPLHGIWLDDGAGHKFVLSFQHHHDKDHEFHVFFNHGKLESVSSER